MSKKKKQSDNTEIVTKEHFYENGWDVRAVMEYVISRMIDGESVRYICSGKMRVQNELGKWVSVPCDVKLPDRVTIIRWLNADSELATSIAHARELQADAINDDITEIMNKVENGELDPISGRVIIAGKQWQAAKMRPKKYGEKIEHEHVGKVQPTDTTKIITAQDGERVYREFMARLTQG